MIMDLNEVPTILGDNGVKIEEKNVENYDGVVDKELEESRIKSIEPEQRCREVEEKQLALESEIRKKDMNLEEIKGKIRVLEDEKLRVEEEIKGLKAKKATLVGENVGCEITLDEDVSRVSQLMVKNKELECEKNLALKEVDLWKRKCEELECRVLGLEGRLKCDGKADISIGINGANPVIGDGDVCASTPSIDFGSSSLLPGSVEGVTPMEGSPDNKYVRTDNKSRSSTKQIHVKRRLAFLNEKSCNEKIAPPSPATAIDIIDCDDDDGDDVLATHRPNSQSKGLPSVMSKYGVLETNGIMTPNTKRKRDLMVVTSDDECDNYNCTPNKRSFKIENSDSEDGDKDDDITPMNTEIENDDDDDNIPISQLKRNHAQGSQPVLPLKPTRPRRRLVKCGQGKLRDKTQNAEKNPDTLTSENVADQESSEGESESSVHSLSSFIVDDSDVEEEVSKDGGDDSDDAEDAVLEDDGGDDSDDSEDAVLKDDCRDDSDGEGSESSDSNLNYEEIISKFRSRRKPNSKWISEADMLSDFGKNPELCMKAVCALYRQQTNEEKACKASLVSNGRGFSKFDGTRGTLLGEYLTDGAPDGDLVKSVEELEKDYPSGVEECRILADRYSKQLFNIYENGEDPYFP